MQQIKIDGISQDKVEFGLKITLESGKEKYSFFNTKKDGSFTKAYDQFEKFRYKIGDVVSAEVKEEKKTFRNKEGKDVNYTQRTILFFQEFDHMPVVSTPPVAQNRAIQGFDAKTELTLISTQISLLKAKLDDINERLNAIEMKEVPF